MIRLFNRPSTLVQAFQVQVCEQPEQPALRFLAGDAEDGRVISYARLDTRTRAVAAMLQSQLAKGQRAVLLFPSGPEYVAAFLACLHAGVIAVPAYPPESARAQHLQRLLSIITDAEPALILTTQSLLPALQACGIPGLPLCVAVDAIEDALAVQWQEHWPQRDDIAFLQYTSGSTSTPKGVEVSHGNLESNEWLIRQGYGIDEQDVLVSWLPLYHDMGLIGGLLQGLYSGIPVVLMSPQYFLERPLRWLEAISRYRGTISGGPDFAYRLCSERIAEQALEHLDLRSWRVAFSGAEPIRQDTLEGFAQRFARCGFSESSYLASYGLAEATLFVTGGQRGEGMPALQLDAEGLSNNRVIPGQGTTLMSCGWPQPEHTVIIVEPSTGEVLAEGAVGEIWSSGPSVARGYWRNPKATREAFVDRHDRRWLRTGDLGFFLQGQLYVTGRLKDMLIIRGQNLYPQDLERSVEQEVEVARKGRVAAFAVNQGGREGVGIALEIGRRVQKQVAVQEVVRQVRRVIADTYQEAPSLVALLEPGSLPKTSSGKLQRSACRALLQNGELTPVHLFVEESLPAGASSATGKTDGEQVRALWCEYLGVGHVADEDSFFALGGNSIQALQLMACLREQFSRDITVSLLLEQPVFADFLVAMAKAQPLVPGSQPRPEVREWPLSPGQRQMWYLWQREPQGCAYLIPSGLHLRGELDSGALRNSLQVLMQRHEQLRTCLRLRGEEVVQSVLEAPLLPWAEDDLSRMPEPEAQARLGEIREQESTTPIDLLQGPLFRVRLIRVAEDEHFLLLTLHHIIADGWSLGILLDELALSYAAECMGQSVSLPVLDMQYRDYAVWLASAYPENVRQQQLEYWQSRLAEPIEPLALPWDHERPAHALKARRHSVDVPRELGSQLHTLAEQHGTSLFSVLLGAFQVLLYRYTGQQHLRIGVPNAGRPIAEAQRLFGYFINTQVLSIELQSETTFAGLIGQNHEALREAQANPAVSLEQLNEVLGQGEGALFQVLFNHLQRDERALKRLPGLLAEALPWNSREAKFDLQLHSEENEQGRIRLSFDYAEALFEPATLVRMATHLLNLLQHLAAAPQIELRHVELLGQQEQQQQQAWEQVAQHFAPRPLPELWEGVAKGRIISPGGIATRQQLDQASNRLAHALRARGIGPESRVAIAMERRFELLVAVLGVLKSGAAYVPLDLDYPQDRLDYMLADSGACLLLAADEQYARFAGTSLPYLPVDLDALSSWPDQPAPCGAVAENLAYILYTSGTTGRPKGVAVSHGALSQRLQWMRHHYAFGEQDVFLHKAPFGFDVSLWECLLPLTCGSDLVLAAPGEHRDPRRLSELVRQHGVTVVHFVPALLQVFVEEANAKQCASLRLMFSGGEALGSALSQRVRQQFPHLVLHNRYGPTEATINITHWPCLGEESPVPIGIPLPDSRCQVLGSELERLPVGAVGELYLGGSALARGYPGRPGLTAERFVPADDGSRLYRSGDRVRWSAEGCLLYLGRFDQQVKLRGNRIELQEVEQALLQLPDVYQAAADIRVSAKGAQLIGYVCATSADQARWREQLAASLPGYMVPAQIICLQQMPLAPSGKLDRRRLPEPVWATQGHVAAVTELERRLATIWSEVLQIPQVGMNDDFFALGGHSLLATRIIARTRQQLDLDLPLSLLFDAPRLQDYADRVAAVMAEGQAGGFEPIPRVDRNQRTPLSYSQQRMWFLWQLEPDSPAYNVGGMARMTGPLDIPCFERALDSLVERHETLRTRFPSEQGIPWQQVVESPGIRVQQVDLSDLPSAQRQRRLGQLAEEQANQPFDLEQGPLLRICLVRTQVNAHCLIITLHHIVTEGWAMDIFARELSQLYDAYLHGQDNPLPALDVQYLDYSAWHRQWLAAGELQRQRDYWLARLGGEQPLLELPSDRPRPPQQSFAGELYRFRLEQPVATRLRQFNQQHGLTLFMSVTAALATLLYRYSGQQDLRIGVPVANRIRPESEGLIGAFLNTQVLRLELRGEMSVEALLQQVRHVVSEGQSHQDLPFDQLVEALQPERSMAYNPLFQVMCNVQRWEFQQKRELAGGVQVEYLVNDPRATKFDLNLEVTDFDDSLHGCLTYSTDLFDAQTITDMAEHWLSLLQAMVEAPQARLAELPMLQAGDDEVSDAPGERHYAAATVAELFEAQAVRQPAHPAASCAGQTLSYAELNQRANQLAHAMLIRGIGPESRVGLALPRSTELVACILAVLKAGAAYVPLDPEYPGERLRYIIEDSDIDLLLCDEAFIPSLRPLPETLQCLDPAQVSAAGNEQANPEVVLDASNLAYVIYTSGSTGRPKGVEVEQGALAMHCQATGELFSTGPQDTELHFYSINFDAATERLLVPLLFGAHVVLREQGQWEPEAICQLIEKHGINVVGFTPSYGSQLSQWLMSQGKRLPVRLCVTGGEALTVDYVQAIRQVMEPQVFFNGYGPTEAVVMPMAAQVASALPDAGSVPIGHGVGRRRLYILDQDLQQRVIGGAGELHVGGQGIARGYLARPGQTAERFVPDPFSAAPGARIYRTGDRVRRSRQGDVEYLGRIDQQVKIRGFRIELGEIEACLQALPGVAEAAVIAHTSASGQQLAGYLVASEAQVDVEPLLDSVRLGLQRSLPDYMLPSSLQVLPSFPLTANGKLDRKQLPLPIRQTEGEVYQAPGNDIEQSLAQVWQDVLGLERVGVRDNFFALGGDSILSIQVVSRARQAGLHFSAKDLFQHQDIAALAKVCARSALSQAEQGQVEGYSGLTPIQHWFFEQPHVQRSHWNQALLLEAQQPLDEGYLRRSMQRLFEHHDGLRLVFETQEEAPMARYSGVPELDPDWLQVVESADETQQATLFEQAQRSLQLQTAPLLRGVLIRQSSRLLLVIHHLVTDGVSWRILLEDLQRLYRQFEQGSRVALPDKTHSQRDWVARLEHYAQSDSLRDELLYWETALQGTSAELPLDHPEGSNLERDAVDVTLRLNAIRTGQLLQQAPRAYRAQVGDLLLAALSQTLCRWSGQPEVLVQLEGHGREELFEDLDLSRTLGWFTSTWPMCLPTDAEPGQLLKTVKERLREVPHKGVGHGVLRYLAEPGIRQRMAALPQPQVTFNYLGQFDQSLSKQAFLRPLVDVAIGSLHDPEATLPSLLSIDCQVLAGELSIRWRFSEQVFERETIQALAEDYRQNLKQLIMHCLDEQNTGITPSDFPLAQLTQSQLDKLPVPALNIEDIYPLTPMQEGLLLHTLLEPGTGIYFMQDRYRINSEIDFDCFERAWKAVIARHEALRASFSWDSSENMLQIIQRECAHGVEWLDWRDLPADQHEARLQALLKEEREAGFDLLHEPPFRLRLICLEPQRYWFIMSNHHILIDAWCRSILMGDFFQIYQALLQGQTAALPEAPRYREFIAWLRHQGLGSATLFWKQALAGFEQPSRIPSDRPIRHDHAGMQVADQYLRLSLEQTAQLQELARQHRLTVNTMAQAAWAMVLRRYNGGRDVLFGVTVAGRPASLPHMQQTVGLFINTIPLRVPMPALGSDASLQQWLQQLLAYNLELREHEHLPLVSIQECSELPQGQPLFDSLFVFENAPVEQTVLNQAQLLNASSDSGRTHTNYPLTVVCYPGDELGLHLSYDQRFFEVPTIRQLLEDFKWMLLQLAEHLDQPFEHFTVLLAEEQQQLRHFNQTEAAYPWDQGYVALFEVQAAKYPERVAARCLEQRWSYRELSGWSTAAMQALLAQGVESDWPVVLLAERGLPLLGMMIGCFKAGAAYLPMDPDHPQQRLRDILSESQARVLFCSAQTRPLAEELLRQVSESGNPSHVQLLCWDELRFTDALPGVAVTAGNLAYVLHTSGSTGKPKGVMVEQAGMLNNQLSKIPLLGLGADDVIAQTASQCFDISVWQFLTAGLCGACVEIIPNPIAQHPQALLEHVRAKGVTVLESVPALIQGLLDESPQALPALRCLLPTGEAMPPELARQWRQRYPDIRMINAYGPAECSDDVALYEVDGVEAGQHFLPIGQASDNNQVHVLGDELQEMPLLGEGELYVAGVGVGRGYWRDPRRTAQAFVPHPLADAPGTRAYRSGDLGRRLADGTLECIGRADHQVKVRGYRIELGEIEACLYQHADIEAAAVLLQQGPTGGYLQGYLVTRREIDDGIWLPALKGFLLQHLPDYMVPQQWMFLECLPLNANGKLDRKALPLPEAGQLPGERVAARTELEQQLLDIWKEVLKQDEIGITDGFLELGGHSLLATRIVSRIQQALQLSLPLRAMFECHTVEELARYIDGLQETRLTAEKTSRMSDLMARLEAL